MTELAVPGLLLLVTHVGLGSLGYFTGWFVARRSLEATREDHHMSETGHHKKAGISGGLAVIIALALVIVAIGVQTYFWQRSEEKDDRCNQRWGQEMVAAIAARSEASSAYNDAQRARSDALDDLLLFAIRNPTPPGQTRDPKTQKMLDVAVKEYTKAVQKVRGTSKTNQNVRDANPFPHLEC